MTNESERSPERATTSEKPAWTTPVLEPAGTIQDVAGGARPGLDSNALPAALS